MTIKVRALLVMGLAMATMWLAGCGHYNCGITFGSSSCTASGGGISQGGNGNSTGNGLLYVADAGGIQGMTFFASNGDFVNTCSPTTCPTVPNVGTVEEWSVIAQEKYLYVLYSTSGQIYGWSIASDGSLTNISPSVYPFQLSYVLPQNVGTQAMILNPAGNLLFVLDPTNAMINVYTISSTGTLASAGPSVVLPSGFGEPFNMAIDGQGKYLYVSNVVGGASTTEIQSYSIGTGILSPLATYLSSTNSQFGLMQMQSDSSGKYLIGTTGALDNADSHLYVLGIAADGSLTPVTGSPFATVNPPDLVAVQPNTGGTLVYSVTISGLSVGGPLEGYTLNASSGALTSVGAPFNVTGDMTQFDQAGTYLYVRDLFNKNMSVFNVGTSSVLTQPDASVGWGVGAWSPTDLQ